MGFDFSGISISGGGAGANSANKSLSNLDAEGNAKFTDKQDKLVSGTNIKSVNGFSLLGSGNIEISDSGSISVDQNYDGTSANAQSGTAVAEGLLTVANRDLSNLSSDGQMVIDSQNGAISNCILDIPQNIQLDLTSNVLTVKKGSILTGAGTVYATYTVASDQAKDLSTYSLSDGNYLIFVAHNGGIKQPRAIVKVTSGTTFPTTDLNSLNLHYNTTDKEFYAYDTTEQTWSITSICYPLCLINVANGVYNFAKDSNGNDMIFNGAGFVGHHAFVYPNVVSLRPNKKDTKERLQSYYNKTNALIILELNASSYMVTISGNSQGVVRKYKEVDVFNPNDTAYFQYVKSENADYFYSGSGWAQRSETPFIEYSYNGTTVTNFTINKVVCLATTEMLDKVQSQVDTNTTAISGKQDTLVSGTNIKTINSTTVLGNGNFALADQSLSNLDSNGQMVVDSVNGTISNCILDIPQNIKLELSGGVLTLKAGSVLVNSGSTYSTYTVNTDKTIQVNVSAANQYVQIFLVNYSYFSCYTLDKIVSGSTDSLAGVPYHIWFDTENKIIKRYDNQGNYNECCYPVCIAKINADGTGWDSFAKDSNGNDMVFNGAGFVGHHAFVYPNVKILGGNGLNNDGSLKNNIVTVNSLIISEMTGSVSSPYSRAFYTINGTSFAPYSYNKNDVNTLDELDGSDKYTYVKSINKVCKGDGTITTRITFIYFAISSNIVTDFTIRQPVRTATVEMLDKKQNDITTITGYDATKTQTLKNVLGVLTWVDD